MIEIEYEELLDFVNALNARPWRSHDQASMRHAAKPFGSGSSRAH